MNKCFFRKESFTKEKREYMKNTIAIAAIMMCLISAAITPVSAQMENRSFQLTLISILISFGLTIVAIVITAILTSRATNKTIRAMIEILDIGFKRSSVAMTYATRKSEKEDRTVEYEDLHEGYEFADEFFKLKKEGNDEKMNAPKLNSTSTHQNLSFEKKGLLKEERK